MQSFKAMSPLIPEKEYFLNVFTIYRHGSYICHMTKLILIHFHFLVHKSWRSGGRGFNPRRGWQHSFVEIDHEIFSMVILSLPLIQEGQLSVSGERMCAILVNR